MWKMLTRKKKDSGIKWIGEIPEDWEIRKLKYTLEERNEKNNPIVTDNILSLSVERGIFPYAEKTGGGNKSKSDLTAYKVAHPNDIVINSMNILAGAVGLSRYTGVVSPVYYTLYTTSEEISITYYYYLFRTREFQRSLLGLGNGIMMRESSTGKLNTIRMRIPMDKLAGLFLPLPPRRVQDLIVKSLAKDIKVVNKLINQTEQSIKELKNYKQSLITESVTKGIDPNVEMKDSGVEWIGDIPKHWNINKIKYNTSTIDTKKDFVKEDIYIGLENVLSYEGRINDYGKLVKDSKEKYFEKGNILYSKLRPYLAKAFIADINGSCSGEFIVFESFKGNKRYLLYWLISQLFTDFINATSYGAKMPRSSWDYIKETSIPRPPKHEENEIVSYLDDKLSQINKLIENKTKVIKELETYKNSLIYEYVTGKKEV